jgi:hypothetical protein
MVVAALIVSYARTNNTVQLIETAINSGASRIYVSIDGPRSKEIATTQTLLLMRIRELQLNFPGQIFIWQRKTNMKSGASVIASLDWVFSREIEACVIEDDLELEKDFFDFMAFGLQAMKSNPKFLMVTGSNPFAELTNADFAFVNYPVSWGWATNQRNWLIIRELIFRKSLRNLNFRQLSKDCYWKIGKKRALLGRIDAWDVPLASEMYKTDYLTLLPPVNLVTNIGFDDHASHTTEKIWPLGLHRGKLPSNLGAPLSGVVGDNLNEEFERNIYRISFHHVISWIIHPFTDKFRFEKATKPLQLTIAQEDPPTT